MSESAKRRVQAIGNQLSPPETVIKKIAGDSDGPRAIGKVVIVTGAHPTLCMDEELVLV